jgi:short-subunit dehydrogenase
MQVAGKLALVTGASSGIGEATARLLAAKGARAAIVARSGDKLAAVARSIRAAGGEAFDFVCDLADPKATAATCAAVEARLGAPDILVNNAGAGRWRATIDTEPEEARAMIELPYLAAFTVTRRLLPAMLARGAGSIVNVTSPASYMAWPDAAGYIAARQALKGFNDALRLEVARRGLRVSLVVLGPVESGYWEHNPGSREHLPKGVAPIGVDAAARTIVAAIEKERRRVVYPAIFRLLFLLAAMAPNAAARA